jgi:hypothetical protein
MSKSRAYHGHMTRETAERRAAELTAEHPDRATQHWMARAGEDGWEVVRISLPPGMRIGAVKETIEAKPRPDQAPDPRPAFFRDVGGPYSCL